MRSNPRSQFSFVGQLIVAITLRVMRRIGTDACAGLVSVNRALITRSVMATLPLQRCLRVLGLVLAVVILLPADDARGEVFPLASAVPHSVPEPLRPNVLALARQHADSLYNHLLMRTDEADRVCGFSKDAKAQLELAAKGAVQHAIDDWLAPIAAEYAAHPEGDSAQLLTMGISRKIDIAEFAVRFVEFHGEDAERNVLQRHPRVNIILINGKVFVDRQGVGFVHGDIEAAKFGTLLAPEAQTLSVDPASVSETGIWRATLDRLLTDTQRSELRTLRTRRELLMKSDNSQVEQMVNYLDGQLLLDVRQCKRITELCVNFTFVHKSRGDGPSMARLAIESLSAQELDELLSDRQRTRWRELTRERKGPFDAYRSNVIWDAGAESRKGADS